jgi:hypothetical protein
MRAVATIALELIAIALSAIVFADEFDLRWPDATSIIEGARFVAGQETILVTVERADFDRKNRTPAKPGWGWDTRIELDPDQGENQYLVRLSITVDETPFVVPGEHLCDLFNPSSDRLSVSRNAKTNSLAVTITGGHTPDKYDVTFHFESGQYVRREFGYTEPDSVIGKRDASKVEHYP